MNPRRFSPRATRAVGAALALLMVATFAAAQESSSEVPQDTDSALVSAYQREFVFLNNEIRLLEERLQEVTSDGQQRVNTLERRLESLQAQLLEITAEVDRRSEELRIAEEEEFEVQDADDTLRNIITQANERLRSNNAPVFSEATPASRLEELSQGDRLSLELGYVFETAFEVLDGLGRVRTEEGSFFLDSGELVEGEIVRVGEIAALGVSPEGSGTLAPAGAGRLRLVDSDTAAVARAAAADPAQLERFPVYLYESLDELVETDRGGGFRETVEGGGIIGLIIIGLGLAAVILIIIRVITLARLGGRDKTLVTAAARAVEQRDLDQARAVVDRMKGAMKRVMTQTVEGLRSDPEQIEDIIAESVLNEQPAIDRFRSAISVFAAVAPLLGLLGTVTGMIATFDVITQFGTGDPRLLSGGISEALITTEFGLSVAIPVLLIGNLLASWGDRITSNLEVTALRLVNAHTNSSTAA